MAPPVRPRHPSERRAVAEAELVIAGRAWIGGRLQPVEVGFGGDGRICAVGRTVPGARRHDVGDRVLLPAATDVHVHLREPGPPESGETIATGTVAAALGGVGLVGEMPNTEPPTSSIDRLEDKESRVRGRAAVDVLLYASPPDLRSVQSLSRRAGGFKLYLSPTTGIDAPPTAPQLSALLDELARVDLPLVVHAEDPALFRPDIVAVDAASWDQARPVTAEEAAVAHLLGAPERLRLHVAHVTTSSVARSVRERHLSCEVTAHHLLLAADLGRDARWKVNPPLRPEAERAVLWQEYRSGRVPILASDHAPHSAARKALPFDLAPSGVPGVESTVPLLLAKVATGDLAFSVFLQSACDRPARFLGQPLGRLCAGHRANLLVVDFRAKSRLRGDRLRSPCGWSPFEGAEAIFPVEHWKDGEKIVDAGEYVGRPSGEVVRPDYAPGSPGSASPED